MFSGFKHVSLISTALASLSFAAACSTGSISQKSKSNVTNTQEQTNTLNTVSSEIRDPWNEWIAIVDDANATKSTECAQKLRDRGIFVYKVFESLGVIVVLSKETSSAFASNIDCIEAVEFSMVVDGSGIAGISN